jgi:hypothetical protein
MNTKHIVYEQLNVNTKKDLDGVVQINIGKLRSEVWDLLSSNLRNSISPCPNHPARYFDILDKSTAIIGTEFTQSINGYSGKFTKRYLKLIDQHAKSLGFTYSEELRNKINDILSTSIAKGDDRKVEFSDNFIWRPGEFGDGGSCFFSNTSDSHTYDRAYIAQNGSLVFKVYNNSGRGLGRCWVNTEKLSAGIIIAHNFYGMNVADFITYITHAISPIPEHMFVQIDSDLYINNREGVKFGYGLLNKDCYTLYSKYGEPVKCLRCGEKSDDQFYTDDTTGEWYCEDCRGPSFYCDSCGYSYFESDREPMRVDHGHTIVCDSCFDDYYAHCPICDDYRYADDFSYVIDENGEELSICYSCYNNHTTSCEVCGETTLDTAVCEVEGCQLCPVCFNDKTGACDNCGEKFDTSNLNEDNLCTYCAEKSQNED